MDIETVLAMAIAAVAEESGVDTNRVTVRSFKEIEPSSLDAFIKEHGISYSKYQLEVYR